MPATPATFVRSATAELRQIPRARLTPRKPGACYDDMLRRRVDVQVDDPDRRKAERNGCERQQHIDCRIRSPHPRAPYAEIAASPVRPGQPLRMSLIPAIQPP